jgi:hypothetical protein
MAQNALGLGLNLPVGELQHRGGIAGTMLLRRASQPFQ